MRTVQSDGIDVFFSPECILLVASDCAIGSKCARYNANDSSFSSACELRSTTYVIAKWITTRTKLLKAPIHLSDASDRGIG